MISLNISFAKVIKLRADLAEVFVDQGVEVDTKMVDEIHKAFQSLFADQFSVLVNKSNAYSSQLNALEQFGKLNTLDKIAVYAPNELAKLSAEFSADIPSSAALNIKVFTDREAALDWLE